MKFKTKLVSVLAAVSMFAAFGVAANAEGETLTPSEEGSVVVKYWNAEKIEFETRGVYETMSAAVAAAQEGDYVRITGGDLTKAEAVIVNKPLSIDGWGHTMNADSTLEITSSGVSITGMGFSNQVEGFTGGKSNIIVKNLEGNVAIKTSYFSNTGAPAVKIVNPKDNADITIESNQFYSSGIDSIKAGCAVSITSMTGKDYTAKVTGNVFADLKAKEGSTLEVSGYTDSSKVNVSGNGFLNGTSACIVNSSSENESDKVYPVYKKRVPEGSGKWSLAEPYTPAAIAMVDNAISEEYDIQEGGTNISLTKNENQSLIILKDQTVTLDLNGHKLTNTDGQHTIINNGTLTVIDSSEDKSGTVDNVSHGKAAFYNSRSGVAYLYGGKYDRSKEAGEYPDKANGNSWYYIENAGKITMKDIVVESKGGYSSLIRNGSKESTNDDNSLVSMTIESGTYSGGVNVLKNDIGKMIINGGTFTAENAHGTVLNWGNAEINGGTFTNTGCDATIILGENKSNTSYIEGFSGIVTITDGTFTGETAVAPFGNPSYYGDADIYAGTFSSDVSDYLADDCAISAGDENNEFTVINPTDGKGTVNLGTYRSAVENGAYEQLWIFEMPNGVSGNVEFSVNNGSEIEAATLDYNTPTAESLTRIGLIITDIPEGITVTAKPAANSVQ